MGEDLGLFALNGQKPQTMDTMETDVMTGQEFKQMVERMRPRLMQMGREFFGSDTEAEEVVQETWLRAWNVRDKVTLTDAYVMRIARNCCVSMWRGRREEVELADESSAAVTEVTPQEEMEERENSEWLASRLQRLPKAEREVWQLFYDEGLTVEEIAEEREDIKVCKVNIDEQPELAHRYRIMTIPTLMVLKDGHIIEQSVGAKPKHQILAMV